MKIIMSINPIWIEKIINGSKKYEYRKKMSENVSKVIMYSTYPVSKVVGEFDVNFVLKDSPEKIYDITGKFSDTDYCFYEKYFENVRSAYALNIGQVKEYDRYRSIQELGFKKPPMNYHILR